MRKRFTFIAVATAALLAPALPASAVTTVDARQDGVNVIVTTCAPTATVGTPCTLYVITVVQTGDPSGAITRLTDVTRAETVVQPGWDITSSAVTVASGTAAVGSVSGSGTTFKAQTSLVLNCAVPLCSYGGGYAFSLNLRRLSSSYSQSFTETEIEQSLTCDVAVTQTQSVVNGIGGRAKVKFGGRTTSLRVWTLNGGPNGYGNIGLRATLKAKLVNQDTCPSLSPPELTPLLLSRLA